MKAPAYSSSTKKMGIFSAVACPIIWGITPIYFHFLADLGVSEALAHRALWAAIILTIGVIPFGFWPEVRRIFSHWHICVKLIGASCLVALNWGTFLFAVAQDDLVASSFGYFIYPLMAIICGVVWLKEHLSWQSWGAVFLASIGVIWKAVALGGVPWIALILGASFAVYAVLRKQLDTEPIAGMVAELILLAPAALLYLLIFNFGTSGNGAFFFDGSPYGVFMAISSGIVTAVPLVLFHIGNRVLSLSMAGFLFFINPSLQLMVGVFIFKEPFSLHDMGAFSFIWLGLIIYLLQPQEQK